MRRWIIDLLRRWDGRTYALSLNVYKVVIVRIDEAAHSPSSTSIPIWKLNQSHPIQPKLVGINQSAINNPRSKESCGQQPHTRASSAPRLGLDSHSSCLPTSKGHSARPTRYHDTSKLPSRASHPASVSTARGSTNLKPRHLRSLAGLADMI
jgi:hypothetical protein